MRFIVLAATLGAAVAPVAARAQQGQGLSLDALAADVVANNPERRFYQRQIETAQVERDAAGRLADPTLTVEFGERKITDPVSNVRTGDAPAYAASIVQPIEFGGRIALRRAIA